MFGVSPLQLIILGLVVLLLFGNRLPDTMRSLGKSLTEFKKGVREGEQEESEEPQKIDQTNGS